MKKAKIISIVISCALIFALGYGIISVVNDAKKATNDIVRLTEPDNNVAMNSESSQEELKEGEEANAGAKMETSKETQPQTTIATTAAPTTNAAKDSLSTALEGFTFAEGDKLMWPVEGDILLKYSMDTTIFYKTLGQYKCNPSISIAAPVGTNVGAAASGIVTDVSVNEETGNTITVGIGGGYVTTYGMLDGVVLKKGDTVKAGQLIGTVATPTSYYEKEGSNLYFKLSKDGEPVDPMGFLNEE